MRAGISQRGLDPVYEALVAHVANRLELSKGPNAHFDTTANCRLTWVDHLLRHPLEVPSEAERFTRSLHTWASDDAEGLHKMLLGGAARLDVSPAARKWSRPPRAMAAIELVKFVLAQATAAQRDAFAPLKSSERAELAANAYEVTTGTVEIGAIIRRKRQGRAVCDLLEKIDRGKLHTAAQLLACLAEPRVLEELSRLAPGSAVSISGVDGALDQVLDTPAGKIVVGAAATNTYRLDEMAGVAVVIDRGGDDTYLEGTLSAARPVFILLDLDGNDTYRATKPGAQGGAILGASLLVDRAGNDKYEAQDVAQGAALAGVGLLVDAAGNDTYRGLRRVQGSAMAGFGVLIDRRGKDEYRGALLAQGAGGPLGFGLLDDIDGKDHYYAGGRFPDPYDDSPGYDAMSQGVGYGPRGVANGGIGVLLDGAGNDVYECDYFSHGAGYWFAAGFARDFAGNDERVGATRTLLDGSKRTEARFLRYGIGFGCHYAIGVLIDDRGNDLYGGDMAGTGFSWDLSVGLLLDLDGADRYMATSAPSQGEAFRQGLAVLLDAAGNDEYAGATQGMPDTSDDPSGLAVGKGNFSFVIDYGGTDKYGSGLTNDNVHQRGSAEGFVIDRANPPATKN